MSEFWVSEGRQWCKYCRKYISSNVNQIRQHESGRIHKENEEEFIRNISLKANHTAAGAASVTGELLERISQLKKEATEKATSEETGEVEVNPPSKLIVELDDDEDGPYPAPAHEAYGPWVEAATNEEPCTEQVPEEFAAEKKSEHLNKNSAIPIAPVLRIGAEDNDDEAEALAHEQVVQSSKKATDAAWDALDKKLRKRTNNKTKKRKRNPRL